MLTSQFHFVFHPSMQSYVEALKGAENLRGQKYMAQQFLLNAEISYVQDIRFIHNEPRWLDEFSKGTAAGLFAEYPSRTMRALASGLGR